MRKSIPEIRKIYKGLSGEDYLRFVNYYCVDERAAVKDLVLKADKKYSDYKSEKQRMYEMFHYERLYQDKSFIAGIDEVGRGPLAGPVVACAAILPKDCDILYINDSKKLSEKKREELYGILINSCISYGIGVVSHERIDEINILQATYEAMRMAISQLSVTPDQLLVDAVKIPGVSIDQRGIVKGDAASASIAAASIIAKVTRDRMMNKLDKQYPGYGFARNKGYGAKEHIDALKKLGPCPIHRKSFIGNFINE